MTSEDSGAKWVRTQAPHAPNLEGFAQREPRPHNTDARKASAQPGPDRGHPSHGASASTQNARGLTTPEGKHTLCNYFDQKWLKNKSPRPSGNSHSQGPRPEVSPQRLRRAQVRVPAASHTCYGVGLQRPTGQLKPAPHPGAEAGADGVPGLPRTRTPFDAK